jgi:hypothetical protein
VSRIVLVTLGALLVASPLRGQPLVFVGALATLAHDGDLDARPASMVFGATSTVGAGVEVRTAWTSDLQIVSASFMQVAPGAKRGKTLQPYGAVGVALLRQAGDQRVGLNLAGGLLAFFTGHVGAALDFRYVRASGTLDGVKPFARTIAGGLVVRF